MLTIPDEHWQRVYFPAMSPARKQKEARNIINVAQRNIISFPCVGKGKDRMLVMLIEEGIFKELPECDFTDCFSIWKTFSVLVLVDLSTAKSFESSPLKPISLFSGLEMTMLRFDSCSFSVFIFSLVISNIHCKTVEYR